MRAFRLFLPLALAARLAAAEASAPAAAPASARPAPPTTDELYAAGQALFDEFAPPEIKAQFEFPTREKWDEFAAKLQQAMEGDSFEALAEYEPQARAALTALETLPGGEEYADWLRERLDLIEAAKTAAKSPPPPRPPAPLPGKPPVAAPLPYYDLWVQRLRARPAPAAAAKLMPTLREAFVAEGVPAELAWLAEVESTLNPSARSPAGAMGLFQLMPATAKAQGLSTWLPDERTQPEKSARAAARLLRSLHAQFGDWPLALAAYNAGAGRVGRALAAAPERTFNGIAPRLPAETRLYVPKVCATVAVRTGVTPERLARPRS